MNEVVDLINIIKQVHDREYVEITGDVADAVFQYHHCYYFAKLLQKFYPEGEMYISNDEKYIIRNLNACTFGMYYGCGLLSIRKL